MKLQDKTGAARRTAMIRLSPLAVTLLLMLAGPAVATESTQTLPLVGNKPVAGNVKLSITPPEAGVPVTVTWSYTDEDGDKESGSTVEWLIDGTPVAGQTGNQYTLPQNSVGKSLQVKVTPKSAAPAVPATGDPVSSALVTIVKDWSGPEVTLPDARAGMTWEEADQFCKGRNATLPTRNELIAIWTKNTAVRPLNDEMCTIHKWPLVLSKTSQGCGATNSGASNYWTIERHSTTSPDKHHYVNMNSGLASPNATIGSIANTNRYSVVCVRN